METKNKKNEQILISVIAVITIIILSVIIFNFRQNYLYINRDRMIIMCYQTNISGSDGEEWAKNLKEQFDFVPDFEVSVYETKSAGNESITITSENGWGQIVTRLSARQGDILLVDNEVFYNVLLKNDLIVSLTGKYASPITDKDGTVYGIDVTGMTVDGLLNHGTSQYVGKGQPLPIKPTNNVKYEHNGLTYSARVIAVIFKGAPRISEAQKVLDTLFGEDL